MTNGKKEDMWVRATLCFRKIEGKWLITHEHDSEPFDMQTFKALLDLKP
jgi:ketosteroid isomerase-like protein